MMAKLAEERTMVDEFRRAMRRLSAGVAIVCGTDNGQWVGLAATSVSSLSMEPPSLLVCLNRRSSLRLALSVGKPFSVNLLAQHHAEISRAFGGAAKGVDRFLFGDWEANSVGVPTLSDAIAAVACVVELEVEYGSHTIFVGRVEESRTALDSAPLVYADGEYR